MSIGDNIRAARQSANLTQKQLGELCGIAEPTIRRYELGKLNPKLGTLSKIAAAMNIDPDTLLGKSALLSDKQMENLRKRISAELSDADKEDLFSCFGTYAPFADILNGSKIVSLREASEIADSLGLSRSELLRDDIDFSAIQRRAEQLRAKSKTALDLQRGIHALEIPDDYLRIAIEDAEEELIFSVHSICGMDEKTISEDTVNGSLYSKWNPRKIEIVREYLEDGRTQIQKLLNAEFGKEVPSTGKGGEWHYGQ